MSAYTDCMKPYMAGGGTDRKLRFCVGAKLCSGKSATEADANKLCSQPRETKERAPVKERTKERAGQCAVNMAPLAACAIRKIDWDTITQETFAEHLTAALQECSCRPKKVKTAPLTPDVRIFANPSVSPDLPVPHWSRA